MQAIDFAKKQLHACLDEVGRIKESEFPYSHPKEALLKIEELLTGLSRSFALIDNNSDAKAVRNLGDKAITRISYYLPILGFVLRSTNARNAFEIHGPLLRLSRDVLGPQTKLIVSSEWDYSPFIYTGIQNLPDFVLIGLPAFESANPFLFPLAGHELGHSIWNNFIWADATFANNQTKKIQSAIYAALSGHRQSEFSKLFPATNPTDLTFWPYVERAVQWAVLQAEEIFCDFVGLHLFAESYLHATSYFLANNANENRSCQYPNVKRRVEHLVTAASSWNITVPSNYLGLFQDKKEPTDEVQRFLVSLADDGSLFVAQELAKKAATYLSTAPKREDNKVKYIAERFRLAVPGDKAGSLTNILNAAWQALEDPNFNNEWKSKLQLDDKGVEGLLKELVLKSIEILEIEQRVGI